MLSKTFLDSFHWGEIKKYNDFKKHLLLYWYKLSRIFFFGVRESLYPRNPLFSATRESLYPRNIDFEVTREILIKNAKEWSKFP